MTITLTHSMLDSLVTYAAAMARAGVDDSGVRLGVRISAGLLRDVDTGDDVVDCEIVDLDVPDPVVTVPAPHVSPDGGQVDLSQLFLDANAPAVTLPTPPSNSRRRWTAHDLGKAVALRDAGADLGAIAGALGRTRDAVRDRLRRYERDRDAAEDGQ